MFSICEENSTCIVQQRPASVALDHYINLICCSCHSFITTSWCSSFTMSFQWPEVKMYCTCTKAFVFDEEIRAHTQRKLLQSSAWTQERQHITYNQTLNLQNVEVLPELENSSIVQFPREGFYLVSCFNRHAEPVQYSMYACSSCCHIVTLMPPAIHALSALFIYPTCSCPSCLLATLDCGLF